MKEDISNGKWDNWLEPIDDGDAAIPEYFSNITGEILDDQEVKMGMSIAPITFYTKIENLTTKIGEGFYPIDKDKLYDPIAINVPATYFFSYFESIPTENVIPYMPWNDDTPFPENYPKTIDETNYDKYLEPLYPGEIATQAASIVKLLNLSGPDYRPESQNLSNPRGNRDFGVPVPYYGGWTTYDMSQYLMNMHGPSFGSASLDKPIWDVLTRISLQNPNVKLTKELIIKLLEISQNMRQEQGSFLIKKCLRILSGTSSKLSERLPSILAEILPLNEVREIYSESILGRGLDVNLFKIDPLKLDFKGQLDYIEKIKSITWLFKDYLELIGKKLDLGESEQVLKIDPYMIKFIPQDRLEAMDHKQLEEILAKKTWYNTIYTSEYN